MNHTTSEAFNDALVALLKTRVPELKEVYVFERIPEQLPIPSALIEYTDTVPDGNGDLGTEQFQARVSFSIYLLGDPLGGATAKLQLWAFANRVQARLHGQHPGTAGGTIATKGAYYDFLDAPSPNTQGTNAAGALECWRLDCECPIVLCEDTWANWPTYDVPIWIAEGVPEFKNQWEVG